MNINIPYLIFGVTGLLHAFLTLKFPKELFYLFEAWKGEVNGEPSDTYLAMTRLEGVLTLIFSLVMIFCAF